MLLASFLSTQRQFDATHGIGRNFEADADSCGEGLVEGAFWIVSLLSRHFKALRTIAGSDDVLRAVAIDSLALPSMSRRRRVNTSPMRSSSIDRGEIL